MGFPKLVQENKEDKALVGTKIFLLKLAKKLKKLMTVEQNIKMTNKIHKDFTFDWLNQLGKSQEMS